MTEHTERADRLLDELEDLRQLLDEPFDEPLDQPPDLPESDFEDVEEIPLLNDQIPTLADEAILNVEPLLELEAPLSDVKIQRMVDEIVAEHLPVLEKKLRERLLEALSFEI